MFLLIFQNNEIFTDFGNETQPKNHNAGRRRETII